MSAESQRLTQFLNVDLDLRAKLGLDELVAALANKVVVLSQESSDKSLQFASLELNSGPDELSLDETLRALIEAVQRLSPDMHALWDGCVLRQINIGIQAGLEPKSCEFDISKETVAMLAGMNCSLLFTVYAVRLPSRA
jgi:hypothetical protein